MSSYKYANIVLERSREALNQPTLYCMSDNYWETFPDLNMWTLRGKGRYDFTTYFNALSVQKLICYTDASSFSLRFETKGSSFELVQTVAEVFSSSSVELENTRVGVDASDEWHSVSLDIQFDSNTVLAGFVIKSDGEVSVRNAGYYVGGLEELRDIELMLSTTTYKKEAYIQENIRKVKEEILNSSDEISRHFRMLVVDNGRTLDVEALSGKNVRICSNDNVGGAGGFTRGMIEALESDNRITHILLMDDDVSVSTESIKRTFNLLRMANNSYANAFVSGAMLSNDEPDIQWEDTGYMTEEGVCCAAKPVLRVTKFSDLVFGEAFKVPNKIKKAHQRYAAWWYCALPIEVVRKSGLPLPYFVRCDDAEYGVRCSPEFMTMNGICVWHDSFNNRYNAAVERYQMTRNTLIAHFTTGFIPNSSILQKMNRTIQLELKKFGYENAELVLDAFEDFMKGPDFYSARGVAEKTFMDANRNKEILIPLDEVVKMAHEYGLTDFKLSELDRQLIDGDRPRAMSQRLNDYLTNNGQRILVTRGKGYAVIPNNGWAYPAGAIRGKQYLIVIDWYNRVGTVRKKDPKRYAEIAKRYKADLKQFKACEKELRAAYAASREKVTSIEFWKNYLGMNS